MANINIYGKLTNATPEGVVAGAEQILDTTQNKKQDVINADTAEAVGELQEQMAQKGVAWSAELAVKAGALVSHEGVLYRAEHDILAGGAAPSSDNADYQALTAGGTSGIDNGYIEGQIGSERVITSKSIYDSGTDYIQGAVRSNGTVYNDDAFTAFFRVVPGERIIFEGNTTTPVIGIVDEKFKRGDTGVLANASYILGSGEGTYTLDVDREGWGFANMSWADRLTRCITIRTLGRIDSLGLDKTDRTETAELAEIVSSKTDTSKFNELSEETGLAVLPPFELGNISIGNSWSYSSSNRRVRWPEGVTVHVYAGDILYLTDYDDIRYYLGKRDSQGRYTYAGWLKSDYVFDGEYDICLLLANNTDRSQSSPHALGDKVRLKRRFANTIVENRLVSVEEDVSEIQAKAPLDHARCNWRTAPLMYIAHRGVHVGDIPENSLDAYKYASLCGFKFVETDISATADGHFILNHDGGLSRIARCKSDYSVAAPTGAVNTMTLDEIRSNYVLASSNVRYRREIPTLEEFLVVCRDYGLFPIIETKNYITTSNMRDVVSICMDIMGDGNFGFCGASIPLFASPTKPTLNIPLLWIGEISKMTDSQASVNDVWYPGRNYGTFTAENASARKNMGQLVAAWTVDCASMNDVRCKGANIIASDDFAPDIERFEQTSSIGGWDAFATDGTVVDGTLRLSAGQYIEHTFANGGYLYGCKVAVVFKGKLTASGMVSGTYETSEMEEFTFNKLNHSNRIRFTAQSDTIIDMMLVREYEYC